MSMTPLKSPVRAALLLSGMAIVSACGNAQTALGPATTSQQSVGTVEVSQSGVFTVNGLTATGLVENTAPGVAGSTFTFFNDGATDTQEAFFGSTPSSYAGVYSTEFAGGASGAPTDAQGAFAGRIGTTDIPASGLATYTGEYRGIMSTSDTDLDTVQTVVGDATLNANFLTSTIGGNITNRVLFSENGGLTGSTTTDLGLGTTTYDANGLFGSSTIGSTLTRNGNLYTASGSYTGVLAGSDSQEVAGTTRVIYSSVGQTNIVESGAFIATE